MKDVVRACVLVLAVLALPAHLLAVEIRGKVVDAKGDLVTVKLASEFVPKVGDKAEIHFEIPGVEEKALVASGKVAKVEGELVFVKIEKSTGKVAKDQLATVYSEAPAKRAAEAATLLVPALRGGMSEILLVKPDGSGAKSLISNKADNTYPAWSPDGKQIVFTSSVGGSGLQVMDADGGNVKRLTIGNDLGPAWSPDGRKIAFTRFEGANQTTTIILINADGTNATSVTKGDAFEADPAWSPDGRSLAFASNRGGAGFRLHVMDADGKNVRDLSRSDNPQGFVYPAWSPDGKKIAYTDRAADGSLQLFLIDAGGGDKAQLTRQGTFISYAAWSPDGQKIAFQSFKEGKGSLHIMNADGSDVKEVLSGECPVQGGRPAWKPR